MLIRRCYLHNVEFIGFHVYVVLLSLFERALLINEKCGFHQSWNPLRKLITSYLEPLLPKVPLHLIELINAFGVEVEKSTRCHIFTFPLTGVQDVTKLEAYHSAGLVSVYTLAVSAMVCGARFKSDKFTSEVSFDELESLTSPIVLTETYRPVYGQLFEGAGPGLIKKTTFFTSNLVTGLGPANGGQDAYASYFLLGSPFSSYVSLHFEKMAVVSTIPSRIGFVESYSPHSTYMILSASAKDLKKNDISVENASLPDCIKAETKGPMTYAKVIEHMTSLKSLLVKIQKGNTTNIGEMFLNGSDSLVIVRETELPNSKDWSIGALHCMRLFRTWDPEQDVTDEFPSPYYEMSTYEWTALLKSLYPSSNVEDAEA